MAKKQTKKVEVEEPYTEETVVFEAPKPEPKAVVKELPKKDTWEIKDRTYYLTKNKKPLSYMIRSSRVFYFDEEKGYERELMCTSNQRSPFVDEFPAGSQSRKEHIIFRNGALFVPKNKQTLQKLLTLYHPHKDNTYYEWKPQAVAENQVDYIEMEIHALNAAMDLDIDMAEAVMRAEIGSKVSEMSSSELKRDVLLFAKKNPALFLELVTDENVMLRNFGIKATELGVILLSPDQRTFSWGSNGRKLMTVPFDEHPYSALAQWFKTDEGMEIYSNIEKRLK